MGINVEQYLKRSLLFNPKERELKNSLLPKLPEAIIDFHSHLGVEADAVNLHQNLLTSKVSTYPYFDRQMHVLAKKTLWENKQIRQVIFGFPLNGVNIAGANETIKSACTEEAEFIPFLLGNPEDIGYTIGQIDTGLWRGLKMYAWQLIPPAQRITDFLPTQVLEAANRRQIPVILHLPNSLNQDLVELSGLAEDFPETALVIAHCGFLQIDDSSVEVILQTLTHHPNIFLDTSVYDDVGIITAALKILGPKRIVYGSDQPYNLIRGRTVYHPLLGKRTMVDNLDYHWVDKNEQLGYRSELGIDPEQIPNMHFSSLQALVSAVETVFPENKIQVEVMQKIFFENAAVLTEKW